MMPDVRRNETLGEAKNGAPLTIDFYRHMFSEQLGVYDVYLRFEHAVNGVEGASKVFGSVNTAGKNLGNSLGETGSRVKAKFTNWWNRKGVTPAQEGVEQAEEPSD
uniref:Uncharacterized protein n=2 Tax=Caenorhabditis japonica TaxID=281687 RepID=A0A8R1IL71_CAEJA